MSNRTQAKKPIAIAIGAALATTFGAAGIANADASPFAMTALGNGYMAAGDREGGGKEGEGKCGGGKMLERMDTNADGELTRAEHDAYWAAKFNEVDENRDEQITRTEMDAARKHKGAEGRCGGDKDEASEGGGKEGEGKCGEGKCGGGKEGKSEMFGTMDTDGDAGVSRAEHAAYWRAKFDEVDTDGDGVVTADDMDAAHEKHGAEGKCGEGKCGGSV
jgi:uncharacterized low-complexity protein